jgi:5-methylcytosine-specific restriction endonuclease McrA
MPVKTCSKCGIEKDTSFFGRHSKTKDSLQIWCKVCVKEYSKTYGCSIVNKEITVKQCTKCNIEKNVKEFAKDKYKKDGYSVICKECNKTKVSLYQKQNKLRVDAVVTEVQKCSICGVEKNKTYFAEDKAVKNGLYHYCNECRQVYNRKYRNDNRSIILQKKKIYRLAHSEQIKEYTRVYYKTHIKELQLKKKVYVEINKEKVSLANKIYKLNNLERIKEYQKTYNEEHKEAIIKQHKVWYSKYYKEHKKEIIQKATEYTTSRCKIDINYKNNISIAWYVSRVLKPQVLERDNYKCQLCGCQDTTANRLECHHIIPKSVAPEKIKDLDNLIIVCRTCHLYKTHKGVSKLYDEELAEKLLEQVKSRN